MATETLRPNAAGDETNIPVQFPDSDLHYDKVDEESPDDDDTYVEAPSNGIGWFRDLYNIPNHSVGSGTINHITVHARGKILELISGGVLDISIKTGGTAYNSGHKTLNNTYTNVSEQWATNPKTEAAWTWDDIDALQIGINLFRWTDRGARCTQVYVVVDYTAGVTHELAGIIAGVASVSGAALITRGLAGLAAGVASISGLAVITYKLTGISQGVASVSGATAILRPLAGISSGIASATASLMKIRWLAGLSQGIASVVGSLPVAHSLAGVVAGVCSVTGSLLKVRWLAGLSQGVATVTGNLFHVRVAVRVLSAVRNLLAIRNIPPVR